MGPGAGETPLTGEEAEKVTAAAQAWLHIIMRVLRVHGMAMRAKRTV